MSGAALTLHHSNDSILAWTSDGAITHSQFLSHVFQLAEQLHNKPYVINLVENRYLFIVALAASLVKSQTTLLPQTRACGNIQEIYNNHPESYYLSDKSLVLENIPECIIGNLQNGKSHYSVPEIDLEHLAIITFTSGSTGVPQPHKKYWGDLVVGTKLAAQRFRLYDKTYCIVATVPPQHMYGFETSVLYPLLTGNSIFGGKPFYPADIHDVFNGIDGPTFLVTTPVHLKACLSTNLEWKNIDFVMSATATLDDALAKQVSATLNAEIVEIFGCTEAGSIASRRTLNSKVWDMYDGIQLSNCKGGAEITAPHLREKIVLSDNINIINGSQFIHLGRSGDMINIAGKRDSLDNLNLKLQELDTVTDGTFFLPSGKDGVQSSIERLTAFVVAPNTSEKEIIAQLSKSIDPVFLPRPLYKVDELPYNETGKLTLQSLVELHRKMKETNLCRV